MFNSTLLYGFQFLLYCSEYQLYNVKQSGRYEEWRSPPSSWAESIYFQL